MKMKPFQCDLCQEGLDSRRQAFKHFDKVHDGAGTLSSTCLVKGKGHYEETGWMPSASKMYLQGEDEGDLDDGPREEPDSDLKVKDGEDCGSGSDLIIPYDPDEEDEEPVDMEVERDPLSQSDPEDDLPQDDVSPRRPQQSNWKLTRKSTRRFEDMAKYIIDRKTSQDEEGKLEGRTCPKCKKELGSVKDMKSHYRLAHLRRYECSRCSRKFTTRGNFFKHVCIPNYVAPSTASRLRLMSVSKNCPSQPHLKKRQMTLKRKRSQLKKVTTSITNIKPQNNPIDAFVQRLSNPEVGRRSSSSFKCRKCSKQYPDIHKFHRHYESSHLKIRFHCEVCSKGFANQSSLNRHERSQHQQREAEENDLPDDHHGSGSVTDDDDETEEGHAQDKSMRMKDPDSGDCSCDLCKLGFNCANLLSQEGKSNSIHLAQGDFPCDICGMGFDSERNLKRHRKEKHDPGLRFYCGRAGCLESFIFRRKLVQHQRRCPVYERGPFLDEPH